MDADDLTNTIRKVLGKNGHFYEIPEAKEKDQEQIIVLGYLYE